MRRFGTAVMIGITYFAVAGMYMLPHKTEAQQRLEAVVAIVLMAIFAVLLATMARHARHRRRVRKEWTTRSAQERERVGDGVHDD